MEKSSGSTFSDTSKSFPVQFLEAIKDGSTWEKNESWTKVNQVEEAVH